MKTFFTAKQNWKLKTKILSMSLLLIFLLLITAFVSLLAVMHSENQLLYKAASGSLNYSADDIESKLSNMEYMTSSLVSNSAIKKNLITLGKEGEILQDPTAIVRSNNSKSAIEATLSDFHQIYKDDNISFINMYYSNGMTSSYNARISDIPQEQLTVITARAHNNSGYPVWITDYCSSSGILYLARDCRQVEDLQFHTLGTVVVGIQMDRFIQDSTSSVLYADKVHYALFRSGRLFYLTSDINKQQIELAQSQLDSSYGIITASGKRFFGLRGTLENTDWNFICLIPYDAISETINLTLRTVFIIITLAVVISYLISHRITKSINNDFMRLVDKMNTFAENETLIPVSPYDYSDRNDEIGILHKQFDKMAQKIQTLIQQNYVYEILAKDAKLKALESQINPHFLYNTLETVNWRAKAIGEKSISSMTESLGILLRESLGSSPAFPTLKKELETVKHYLTIQKIRYENRLDYCETIDPSILSVHLPHLTLQPLVENAIRYTIEENAEDCSIMIHGTYTADHSIVLDIINSNSQFSPNMLEKLEQNLIEPHGFGIGLLNIHKRLQLIYGAKYGLTLFNLDEEHAVARITLPGGTIC